MPIVIRQLVPANAGQPGYGVAKELARQCADQYHQNILPGTGGGIAGGSCWAALAVAAGGNFPNLNSMNDQDGGNIHVGVGGLGYGISFGNSQMAMINGQVNLPGFGGGGHAERTAINNAAGQGLYLSAGNHAVMFVQLHPCNGLGTPDCQTWLGAAGSHYYSAQLNAVVNPVRLNVYYRFVYPGAINNMITWNNLPRAAKQTDIINTW